MDRDINSIVATSDRPLSSNRADLEKRYSERYPLYKQRCDRHVKISNDVEENSQSIIKDFFNENTCD
jgi:shikimate kinase